MRLVCVVFEKKKIFFSIMDPLLKNNSSEVVKIINVGHSTIVEGYFVTVWCPTSVKNLHYFALILLISISWSEKPLR